MFGYFFHEFLQSTAFVDIEFFSAQAG